MPDEAAKFPFDMCPELFIYVDVVRIYVQFQNTVPPGKSRANRYPLHLV